MTDLAYFTPKTYPDYVGLLRQGLLTIEEYDHLSGGDWGLEAVQAAADLVRDRRAPFASFRRYVWGPDD
jgi:hypothetical protein